MGVFFGNLVVRPGVSRHRTQSIKRAIDLNRFSLWCVTRDERLTLSMCAILCVGWCLEDGLRWLVYDVAKRYGNPNQRTVYTKTS